MAKRTPLPCTPANCGDLFPKCGSRSTYENRKCRCDSCAAAKAEAGRRYREANREAKAEYGKRYYRRNREAHAQSMKRWRVENLEHCLERDRLYRAENREKEAERGRKYREANREKVRQCQKRWILANQDRHLENRRQIAQRHRAKKRNTQIVEFTQEQLEQRFAYYGNKCYLKLPGLCTGAFDHVEHVKPISKGGAHMLANLRPACEPCNRYKLDKWPFKVAS